MSLPTIPLDGFTLITGPSNVGKTRATARALERWVAERGPDGTVVFDFAPELERNGTLLGGRLSRFTDVPDETWTGVLDAHAPRAEGETEAEATRLAADNAARAERLFEAAPKTPRAVFVNDATIPFQHKRGEPRRLISYCERAEVAVLNAFESDELGVDDPVSARERTALEAFANAADRRVKLH